MVSSEQAQMPRERRLCHGDHEVFFSFIGFLGGLESEGGVVQLVLMWDGVGEESKDSLISWQESLASYKRA